MSLQANVEPNVLNNDEPSNNQDRNSIDSTDSNHNRNNAAVLSPQSPPVDNSRINTSVSVPLAMKQYEDIIQFQEPSTSKNYSVKTEIRINILSDRDSRLTNDSNSQISLSLMRSPNEKGIIEEESYHTIDSCIKDKNINTNPTVQFDRVRVVRGEPPPPYEPNNPPPAYSARQGRPPPPGSYNQAQPVVVIMQRSEPAHNASRGSTYRRNDPDSWDSFSSFDNIEIRHKFVQKVYAILAIQLLFTFGFVMLCTFEKSTKRFVQTNLPAFLCFAIFWFILYIALMCYKAVRRMFPLNFVLLALFTICQSYTLAVATVFYSTKVVLITLGATAGICFLVSLLACQNWFDITKWGFILAIGGIIIMVFGFIAMLIMFLARSSIAYLIFAGLATALFSMYLLYDTQCILGGRRVEISPEEYIYGVLTLYVDIVMIFMYMLQLIGACSN